MTQREIDESEWQDERNWIGWRWLGLYDSRRDSRAFVPKRFGLGATVNLARRAGIGFLVGVFLFVGLMLVLTRRR